MTTRDRSQVSVVGVAAGLLVALAISACKPEDHVNWQPVLDPAIAVTAETPGEAATLGIRFLREDLAAVAAGDRAFARACRSRLVEDLLAQQRIVGSRKLSDAERTELLDTLVRSWSAALNYYQDGLSLDELLVEEQVPGKLAVVTIPAQHDSEHATVEIVCVAEDGLRWRLLRFALTADRRHKAPTTQSPATSPAP